MLWIYSYFYNWTKCRCPNWWIGKSRLWKNLPWQSEWCQNRSSRFAGSVGFSTKGDSLVVWRLDRLGRSLKDLIETVGMLEEQGIGFRSLHESIDTTTSGGRLIFHIFGALAEFERNLIRERTGSETSVIHDWKSVFSIMGHSFLWVLSNRCRLPEWTAKVVPLE